MMTAGSPVDFCVKSGRWRDKQGRFCKAPLDVISVEARYPAEVPLTDKSYAVGAVALLRPEKVKQEKLVGIVEVVICRATSQYVFVSSPLLSGSDLRPRQFLKSSLIRTNRMQEPWLFGLDSWVEPLGPSGLQLPGKHLSPRTHNPPA